METRDIFILVLSLLWWLFCEAEGYIDARHMDRPMSTRQSTLPSVSLFRFGLMLFPMACAWAYGGVWFMLGLLLVHPALHHGRYFVALSNIDPRRGKSGYWTEPNRISHFENSFVGAMARKVMLVIGCASVAWSIFGA
jgi:hypothetical protein